MNDFIFNQQTIDNLLEPVTPENPCGNYLFYDDIYDRIKEAMRDDDDSLPVGVWEHDLKHADWQQAIKLCLDTLQHKSKDLQIAAWLTRSIIREYDVQGISWGLSLILRLFSTFFPHIHPRSDDVYNDKRIGLFEWIDQMLSTEAKFLSLTTDSITYADVLEAEHLEHMAQKDTEILLSAEKEGKLTKERIRDSVISTASSFYQKLHLNISESLEAITAIQKFLDTTYGTHAPSFSSSIKTLNDIVVRISIWLKERNEDITTSQPDILPEKSDTTEGNEGLKEIIKSRRDAYRQLEIAANFLLKVEPHSPTPYLVHRAIAWGDMPLAEVFKDILHGSENVFELLGMAAESE